MRKERFTFGMITKSDIIAALGSVTALADEANCSKQAVSQWGETVPLRSAVNISRKGRWSVHDLRPDIFGEAPTEQAA